MDYKKGIILTAYNQEYDKVVKSTTYKSKNTFI